MTQQINRTSFDLFSHLYPHLRLSQNTGSRAPATASTRILIRRHCRRPPHGTNATSDGVQIGRVVIGNHWTRFCRRSYLLRRSNSPGHKRQRGTLKPPPESFHLSLPSGLGPGTIASAISAISSRCGGPKWVCGVFQSLDIGQAAGRRGFEAPQLRLLAHSPEEGGRLLRARWPEEVSTAGSKTLDNAANSIIIALNGYLSDFFGKCNESGNSHRSIYSAHGHPGRRGNRNQADAQFISCKHPPGLRVGAS